MNMHVLLISAFIYYMYLPFFILFLPAGMVWEKSAHGCDYHNCCGIHIYDSYPFSTLNLLLPNHPVLQRGNAIPLSQVNSENFHCANKHGLQATFDP